MCQKIIQHVNLLQSFLLICLLYSETNIIYLDNCAYRIAKKQMTGHPDKNHFATD